MSVKGYNDITPRVGAAYDVFGSGKTAVKVNVGKYLQAATNDENYWANNPALRTVTSVLEPGMDGRQPQLRGGLQSAESGGAEQPRSRRRQLRGGDGHRSEFRQHQPEPDDGQSRRFCRAGAFVRTTGSSGRRVQQQLMPRISLEVSYNRRWFGNFFVTDNLLTKASDYNQWNLTVPQNPNLPGGGTTATYFDVNPAVGTGARNYQTFETDYAPARTQYWHGVTTSFNARLHNSLILQAGTSTGRGVQDTCALVQALPETLVVAGVNQQQAYCHVTEPWATLVRGLAAYTVPKIDVLVSASIRSVPNANIGMGSNSATNGASRNAN